MNPMKSVFQERGGAAPNRMRELAEELYVRGRRPLRLSVKCAYMLRRKLKAIAGWSGCADETLRRMKTDLNRMENCLHFARNQGDIWLPAAGGAPRLLMLARILVASGEARLTQKSIMTGITAFGSAQRLQMQELECLHSALCIALCEALSCLCAEALKDAKYRRRAQKWALRGGRIHVSANENGVFFEHALQLAAEMERPDLREKIENALAGRGEKTARVVESVHRACADRCFRLENLMELWHLLETTDWEKFFREISEVDMELREDPAKIYGTMDAASRAEVRRALAQLAHRIQIDELSVARCGLQAAWEALRKHGEQDPRATVCWYILEDEGRLQLCRNLGSERIPRKRLPDPEGKRTVFLILAVLVFVAVVLYAAMEKPLMLLYVMPIAWVVSMQLISMYYPRWLKPSRIVKLKLDQIPDCARTLVVLPVLLSSEKRVLEMTEHMEALGCLEKDENIDFLLLGDFKDADQKDMPGDILILNAARKAIAALNARTDRHKYFYLHRERSYREKDKRWMGENRKRGALMALNRMLLMKENAEVYFAAEGSCALQLAGRYRYVVTLDADTQVLPGDIHRLIGAMHHPLNRSCILDSRRRGYAVLQPDMQLMAEACTNEYVHLTAGTGGVDGYPVSVSDFYQDMTGRGSFAGKGIYDIRAFAEATEGVLQDDVILSHDLIEGILAGSGYLNDVHFYDGSPDNLEADLMRLHRWTRGDWQLLPVLFSHLHIKLLDRMKLLGNLLRSLYAPSLLGLLIHSVWADAPVSFIAGLLLCFKNPILQFPRMHKQSWKVALLELALLPAETACVLDAILRTLWRLAVSHRHLMEWVPAADAGRNGSKVHVHGRIASLLLLPGLLRPFWIPAVLAIAALFALGANWAKDLSEESIEKPSKLNDEQNFLLRDLAERIWAFFERYVPEDGCGLPPDNVQMDPPRGEARRTSPTNIGLYLMSCIAAHELGFLTEDKMLARIEKTVYTLEELDKWHGQLYNWYGLDDLSPLHPRYVSSVDSGNLAGALLLCEHMLRKRNANLASRMHMLVVNMDLAALYDEERKLFRIGMDVESGRMSESHYDLYASESRILSYAAMMLGQVPVEHWKHLSRSSVRIGKGRALLSWSGTMFEYLMPELLLRSPGNTLAGQSRKAMLAGQMEWGRRLERPWGISESGYYAFDLHLNYQYRAFGLRDLAMSSNAVQDVVAPYAAALALQENPAAAAENLRHMCELGWCGEFGMYEAADYMHLEAGHRPHLVRSYMAHHQGMALCAMCNVLCGDVLAQNFMKIPQARALRMLLQEKEIHRMSGRKQDAKLQARGMQDRSYMDYARKVHRRDWAADVHLICSGGTRLLANQWGGIFVSCGNVQINRFSSDLLSRHDGLYVHAENLRTGEKWIVGSSGRMIFDLGSIYACQEFGSLLVQMCTVVSPEDGSVYQELKLENTGAEACTFAFSGCMAVALAPENDMRAHPVFQNLFAESEYLGDGVLAFHRRRRDGKETLPELVYLVAGGEEIEFETSYEKLTGRCGSLGIPGGIQDFSASAGCVLNPCAALKTKVQIEAGQHVRLHFALALVDPQERSKQISEMQKLDAPEHAMQLAATQMRAVMTHAGIDGRRFRLYQRLGAILFDGRLRRNMLENTDACAPVQRSLLWKIGISGDLPILLVEFENEDLDCVREAMRLHAFWRLMGVQVDFVLINNHGSDYHQPSRGSVNDLLSSSHLNGCFNSPGGVFVLERQNLDQAVCDALHRLAAVLLHDGDDAMLQLRSALDGLLIRETEPKAAMKAETESLPANLKYFNGYGGFDGEGYRMLVKHDLLPPAPWSNIISSEHAGAVVTERGGGFAWFMNSRSGRLTRFANDAQREGWGWMFYLMDETDETWIRMLPGDIPMTDFIVQHKPGESSWHAHSAGLAFEVQMRACKSGIQFDLLIRNEGNAARYLRLAGFVDWLMGTDEMDTGALRCWSRFGGCFSSGAMEGVGCFICDDPRARAGCDRQSFLSGGDLMEPRGLELLDLAQGGWTLHLPLNLKAGEQRKCRFLLGCGRDIAQAYELARDFRSGEALRRNEEDWKERLDKLRIQTPDEAVNLIANGFLQAQILNGRIRARTGLYQPGGAYGFRDQLQDMLAMIHYEPQRVRGHLLYCAARQFEAGDVLHWWHEPYRGVRTQISDDLLFLPYVTAKYVQITGDESVLWDSAYFLEDIAIPEGREDIYADMRPSSHCATLHEHCMRAFRRAERTGAHGLCLMGAGDWNDGMNRVGNEGRGESVWLSEFLAVCAAEYARIAPNSDDQAWLVQLHDRMIAAVEAEGWDGEYYLRAYGDDGRKLGSKEGDCCRIDAISQAWAVLAGLDRQRCESAINAAWEQLADENLQLIRLLYPPFDGEHYDPGYIAAYPEGIRENGAQYTHAACWMLFALAEMGDAERAHHALQMLLPVNHARCRADAQNYRVEPYVMAADIYTNPDHAGRGGWTWYTGSAAWMLLGILKLLGYEREGNRVRMNALLGDWNEVQIELQYGLSRYRLICRRDMQQVVLDGEPAGEDSILLQDDGKEHTALFPPRDRQYSNKR